MGLDMYLTQKFYVKNWSHQQPAEQHKITIKKGGNVRTDIDVSKICYIETEEIYWRKANQIHKWFVHNVQEGKDDCGTYYVSEEQLQKLLDTINQVLESTALKLGKVVDCIKFGTDKKTGKLVEKPHQIKGKVLADTSTAERLLPSESGFFFGSVD